MPRPAVSMGAALGNPTDRTPSADLMDAITDNDIEQVQHVLAEASVPLDACIDSDGATPLLLAVSFGNCDIARLLIDAGAPVTGKVRKLLS